jgi:STE24 endopeptidase
MRKLCALLLVIAALGTYAYTFAQATAPPSPPDRVEVPQPTDKAVQYHRTGTYWWVALTLWGFALPLLFLFTGFSAKLRDVATRVGKKWFFVVAIYVTLYAIILFLIDLPVSYVAGYARQHAYGLSNQTLGKWFGDSIKALAVGLISTPLFAWFPLWLIRRSPKRWWLYTAMAAIPFVFIVLLVVPVWVDPLFNEFGPMKDKQLEQKILSLADRAGIEGARVFEVNKSVDTKTVNAYVTGLFNTKRIVLWDTIIARLDDDELLFVMGHEMGHFVLNHVAQIIFASALVIALGLFVVHRSAQWFIRRWSHRFGFTELSDVAAIPLIMFLFSVVTFVITPLILTVTRHNEHEADRFGLEITHTNHAAATAFVKLQQENLGVPRPNLITRIFRSSHPSLADRIEFCNRYRPWERGAPEKYRERFK